MFTFIESAAFERARDVYLDDDEYAELQLFMMENPEAGRVTPGSVVYGNCAGSVKVWESAVAYE